MKLLKGLDALLQKVEGGLIILLLAAMVAMAFLQVLLRNVFSGGLIWGDILLRHLVLWIGFLGAALAAGQERHISIDAFARFLPRRAHLITRVVTNLFAAAVCYFLFDASLTFLSNEILDGRTVYGQIPSWYAQLIIPIGFGIIGFHFLVRVIVHAVDALSKEPA